MPTDIVQIGAGVEGQEEGDIYLAPAAGGTFDIAWGDSTKQHFRDIILARKGDLRTNPAVGVGLEDFVDDDEPQELMREISKQLNRDGAKISTLTTANIDGKYPS